MDDVARSHVEENEPAPAQFDRLLKRDLTAYFNKVKGGKVTVYYKFLRIGATQSGVSYPKYYVWVGLYRQKKAMESGAVRAAAIDREYFQITDYLSAAQIRRQPGLIDSVFPQPVCERIRQILKLS
jgi:hypothetical protein